MIISEDASFLDVSPYRIVAPLDKGQSIVYSTLTTSLVVMDNDEIDTIFNNKDFSDVETCSQLLEMGLLFNCDEPQSKILKESRTHILEGDTGITSITIAPTMSCNARCAYCFEKGARWGTMDAKTADAVSSFIINNCPRKKVYIAWFGGEPLLAPHIIDRITDNLLNAGIEIESTVTTNGLLLNESVRHQLKRWGTYRVQITLDGIGEDYNAIKNYVGVEGDPFSIVLDNIQALFDMGGISVHIRLNYASTNRAQIEETFCYIHERFGKYDNLYLYGAPLDLPEIKGYSEFDEDEGALYLDVLRMSLDNGFENDELNFREGVNVSGDYNAILGELMLAPFPAPCFMINRWRYVVDDQGLLYKCQKHLGKPQYACGNVFDGIDENDCYNYYATDELHDQRCESCFLLPVCQGGCNANRLIHGDTFACPPSKSIAKDLVCAYYKILANEQSPIHVKGGSHEGNL